MSSNHPLWLSIGSTDRPMIFTLRRSNSGLIFAMYPSSVVHTGVKSFGCENNTAQPSPTHSWKRIRPSVVSASKSGAVSPIFRAISSSSSIWAEGKRGPRHFGIRKIANPSRPCHAARTAVNDTQLRRSLDLVGEVADAPTAEEFTRRAADGLARLIPAQGISFNEWDFAEHRLTAFHERTGYRPELDYLTELWPQCDWLVRQAPPERI